MRKFQSLTVIVIVAGLLGGCDQLGIDTPEKVAQRKGAEAKAVGAACRHAMRAIEDCYLLNPKAEKSAVFEGWREMDEYMRENKIEGVAPVVPRTGVPLKPTAKAATPDALSEDDVGAASGPKPGGGE
ncbi:MAG: hypothetical protein A3G29_16080 [Burkholderiales bacterium RIFCSPLOWO2_12_FULL_64_99]|nr:MAG: hypothetical protein A3E52_01205 [Burkholderiales bacterium RIFCSPHIGHO2_12_FULL_63_20]OGB62065.1 MAG: hypothetical protein A3G29_16080 [Burkholderiales bacterium RIFCSPLOWO2_12_FULL_64_99]